MKSYYLHPRWVYESYGCNKDLLYAFETLIYLTRFSPGIISGVKVNQGQLLIRTKELAEKCKMSHSQMRTCLKRFTLDGGITTEQIGKKGLLITVLPPFVTGDNSNAYGHDKAKKTKGISTSSEVNKIMNSDSPSSLVKNLDNDNFTIRLPGVRKKP